MANVPGNRWMVMKHTGEWVGPLGLEELRKILREGRLSHEDHIAAVPRGWKMPLYRHENSIITETFRIHAPREEARGKAPSSPAPVALRAVALRSGVLPQRTRWELLAALVCAAAVLFLLGRVSVKRIDGPAEPVRLRSSSADGGQRNVRVEDMFRAFAVKPPENTGAAMAVAVGFATGVARKPVPHQE